MQRSKAFLLLCPIRIIHVAFIPFAFKPLFCTLICQVPGDHRGKAMPCASVTRYTLGNPLWLSQTSYDTNYVYIHNRSNPGKYQSYRENPPILGLGCLPPLMLAHIRLYPIPPVLVPGMLQLLLQVLSYSRQVTLTYLHFNLI